MSFSSLFQKLAILGICIFLYKLRIFDNLPSKVHIINDLQHMQELLTQRGKARHFHEQSLKQVFSFLV